MDDEKHLVELYQDLERAIEIVRTRRDGHIRKADRQLILTLLRNYRREHFGNPLSDKERADGR